MQTLTRYFSMAILFFAIASIAHAQTNTFPTTGNVGVGTTTPTSLFQVNGGASQFGGTIDYSRFASDGDLTFTGNADFLVGADRYAFRYQGNPNYGLLFSSTNSRYEFRDASGVAVFWQAANGNAYIKSNLAIGSTSPPAATLDITPVNGAAILIHPFGTLSGNTGGLRFMELAANGTNYVAFRAPDNITSNKTWVLPSADGTTGQYLKTDGAGNLGWANDANTVYTSGTGINIAGTVISNTAPDQTVTINGAGATTISGSYPNFTISSTDNNTTYSAGTGLLLSGTTFSNTAPDQVVTINTGTGIAATGAYPNFTITNTTPDQTVTLTGDGATSVTGTYPNFTITSTDENNIYTAGAGIDVTGTTISNTLPDQTVTLTGDGATSVTGTYPNFTITSTDENNIYTAGAGIDVTGTTITNTSPDQTVTLTGDGATSVTGTYPNFTITSTDENNIYTAGAGIDVTGTTITNTSPDQTVTLTGDGATSVTGTYPNFTITSTDENNIYTAGAGIDVTGTTISNTAPDQTVTMTGAGSTTVSGTYPDFIVTTNENDPQVSSTSSNKVPKWNGSTLTDGIITDNGTNVGINNSSPTAKLDIAGNIRIADGTQGANKILMSDATGLASWTNAAPGTLLGSGTNGYVTFWSASNTISGNSNFYWDNTNARLGIGTSSPSAKLHVVGGANFQSGTVDINTASNNAVNIGTTGYFNAGITIGNNDGGDGLSPTVSITTGDWAINTTGVMSGISGITSDGLITSSGGLTNSGGAVNINTNNSSAVNIGTLGGFNNTITIGNNDSGDGLRPTVAISSGTWGINGAGVASGLTGITSGGTSAFTGGITVTGGNINLNQNSNFPVAIGNQGSFNNTITIGNNDGGDGLVPSVAIATGDWNISTSGIMTGISGITSDGVINSSAGLNITAGATTINPVGSAVNVGTIGGYNGAITIGNNDGGDGFTPSVAISSGTWGITTAGVASGLTGFTTSGSANFNAGITVTGGNINLNQNSNFPVAIGTQGSFNNTITIGNNDGGDGFVPSVAIATGDWSISTSGVMTGISGITSDGLITSTGGITNSGGAVNINTNNSAAVNMGTQGGFNNTISIGNNDGADGFLPGVAITSGSSWNITSGGAITTNGNLIVNGNTGLGVSPTHKLQLSVDDAVKPSTGTWTIASDQRLKTHVTDFNDGLDVLEKIHPVWFEYNGTAGMPTGAPAVGIIAQEMQQAAPYMIGKFTYTDSSGAANEYLDYNPNALFYILVNSVKTINAKNDSVQKENDDLHSALAAQQNAIDQLQQSLYDLQGQMQNIAAGHQADNSISSASNDGAVAIGTEGESATAILRQNVPNPFDNTTLIPFRIPKGCSDASIMVTNVAAGKVITVIPISCDENHVVVDAGEMASGTYTYTLMVDGKIIASKEMILTK